jgi:hypothetical protein
LGFKFRPFSLTNPIFKLPIHKTSGFLKANKVYKLAPLPLDSEHPPHAFGFIRSIETRPLAPPNRFFSISVLPSEANFFLCKVLCHFTAKDIKGVHFVLLIANPFLNLSPSGRLWHSLYYS